MLKRFRQKQGDTKGTKEFIAVLMLFKTYPSADVISAAEAALSANVSSSEAVIHLLKAARDEADHIVPLDNWLRLPPADVSIYDQIGGGL